MALINDVWNDVERFLTSNKKLFFNERDLQVNLANYLMLTGRYIDVQLEYPAPLFSNIKLDIVVSRNSSDKSAVEYVPIELKYRTKKIPTPISTPIFGKATSICRIIKDQSAQDLGRYGFWNDVHRIEEVKKRYPSINGGIVLFLTNDNNYLTCPKSMATHYNYEQFSMTVGVKRHLTRNWLYKIPSSYPSFSVSTKYTINWKHVTYISEKFYYCMLKV